METPCPVCASESSDLSVLKNEFRVVRCRTCSCLFVSPRPSEEQLIRLYQDYEKVVEALGGKVRDEPVDLQREARYHVSRIMKFVQSGRLLDLGCGRGDLLRAARPHFDVYGVDVAPRLWDDLHDLRVFRGRIEDSGFEEASFDVVTAVEILEHLFDPKSTLREVHRILASQGVLLVQTGDASSLPARLDLDRWLYIQPPVHLNFFTREALVRLLRSTGFRIFQSWSFGRAPQRVPGFARFSDSKFVRKVLDAVAKRGVIGQVYITSKT